MRSEQSMGRRLRAARNTTVWRVVDISLEGLSFAFGLYVVRVIFIIIQVYLLRGQDGLQA